MIGHQLPAIAAEAGDQQVFFKYFQKCFAVFIIVEELFAFQAARHEVRHDTRNIQSSFTRHGFKYIF
jgi:hypothetical protein